MGIRRPPCNVRITLIRFEVLDETEFNLFSEDDWQIRGTINIPDVFTPGNIGPIDIPDLGAGESTELNEVIAQFPLTTQDAQVIINWSVFELDPILQDAGRATQIINVHCNQDQEFTIDVVVEGFGPFDSDGLIRLTIRVQSTRR